MQVYLANQLISYRQQVFLNDYYKMREHILGTFNPFQTPVFQHVKNNWKKFGMIHILDFRQQHESEKEFN